MARPKGVGAVVGRMNMNDRDISLITHLQGAMKSRSR